MGKSLVVKKQGCPAAMWRSPVLMDLIVIGVWKYSAKEVGA